MRPFNPWIGCTKISPACAHCYAERDSLRWGRDLWGDDKPRQVTSDANWRKPLQWNKKAGEEGVRKKVFCASLADVFEEHGDVFAARLRLFELIEKTPNLDWQLLTKRPENMTRFAPDRWRWEWPNNVWAGITAENQECLDKRIGHLFRVPARIRFLSCEPLMGPIDLVGRHDIDWVIVGGESGAGFREMKDEWVRNLFEQTRNAEIAFFYKQGFGLHPDKEPLIDDVRYMEFPK